MIRAFVTALLLAANLSAQVNASGTFSGQVTDPGGAGVEPAQAINAACAASCPRSVLYQRSTAASVVAPSIELPFTALSFKRHRCPS